MRVALSCTLLGVLFGLYFTATPAQTPAALVSIVIDDLGNNPREDRRALALPAPVALAVLPHTPFGVDFAESANRAGKEVLLHLPMDPENRPDEENHAEAGPGRLENHMTPPEIAAMFRYDLQTVPHAVGVNNHMGSLLTRNPDAMDALMRALKQHGNLFFLDSRTSAQSIAARVAQEHGIPTLARDVFLDSERGEENVRNQLHQLERLLKLRGRAVAIGHPYPETLTALENWLPTAAARGIRVVPLSVLLNQQTEETIHAERTDPARSGL